MVRSNSRSTSPADYLERVLDPKEEGTRICGFLKDDGQFGLQEANRGFAPRLH
jgi:hypothetical protein